MTDQFVQKVRLKTMQAYISVGQMQCFQFNIHWTPVVIVINKTFLH